MSNIIPPQISQIICDEKAAPPGRKLSRFSVEKAPDALQDTNSNTAETCKDNKLFTLTNNIPSSDMTNSVPPISNDDISLHKLEEVSKTNGSGIPSSAREQSTTKFTILADRKKEPSEMSEYEETEDSPSFSLSETPSAESLDPSISNGPTTPPADVYFTVSSPPSTLVCIPVPPPNTPKVESLEYPEMVAGSIVVPILVAQNKAEGRFKRVYVNGQFPRGRWKCSDFKDSEPLPPSLPNKSLDLNTKKGRSSQNSSGANSLHLVNQDVTDMVTVANGPVPTVSWAHPTYSDSASRTVSPPTTSVSNSPRTEPQYPPLAVSVPSGNVHIVNSANSLLHTLFSHFPHPPDDRGGTIAPAGSPLINPNANEASDNPSGTGTTNVVAIDNKIEQAMDLVKTHLMYAVREEIEVLRAKIQDMEKKMNRLEQENCLLRERVPADVAANITAIVAQQTTQNTSNPSTQPQ